MNFDPKAVRRALMVAKDLATSIDPGFANIQPPMPPQGVPLERASGGQAIHLTRLGKFFEGDDPLAKFVPERATHSYALHPDKWVPTFYSLTNKDPKKLNYYGPKQVDVPSDAIIADMAHANRFYRANTEEERMAHAKAYRDSMKPVKDANLADYKLPELLIPRSEKQLERAEGGEVEAAGMGINVRSDKKAGMRYADEIVDGNKLYETRDTDSLRPYVGKRVAIVRTGEGPAKAIGEVTVGEPVVADQDMFHKMRPHHLVPAGSAFDIKQGGQKYLYPMHDPVRFDDEKDVGAGIIARKVISKAEGGSVDDHPDQGYAPKPPGVLDVDNPGGDWLKENREYSESRGYMPSGAPKSFGKTTAVWREPKSNEIAPVYLPVSMLAQLPGVMSEQKNVRSHDLDWLTDHMGKTGKLPKINDREYKPFITVDHRGMPFVSEGNHRIMAAAKLGWDYLPVEVRYFNGAEDVDGPLHPDRIREMHGINMPRTGGVENRVVDSAKAARRALMIAKDELGHGRT